MITLTAIIILPRHNNRRVRRIKDRLGLYTDGRKNSRKSAIHQLLLFKKSAEIYFHVLKLYMKTLHILFTTVLRDCYGN